MAATRLVPPSASALIASLRGVGYSLETALADLVDNSVAAGARTVEIDWDWHSGDPVATILDDGHGMTEERLIQAMRFGGTGPDAVREETDLGRFGLGLKTASLSQCRHVAVVSKTAKGVAAFSWDLDVIRGGGDSWHLVEGSDALPDRARPVINGRTSGTAVVWRKVDFGRLADRPDHAMFLESLDRVEQHLGMVFHRFLAGDARRIAIRINGRNVVGWDPFLEGHESTIPMPEQLLPSPGGRVRVRGFVLPHRDRFQNESEFEAAGGPDGWTAQQGFYVYRQKRLLSAGGWLGLGGSRAWTREEPSRLARVRVDIPNSADREWRIDIRKAVARPPDAIRKPLQRLAGDLRKKAREVFVHRGNYGARPKTAGISRIWGVNPATARRRYTLQRDHEIIGLLRGRMRPADRKMLDALFDLIERTVPVERVWLDVTEQGVPVSNEDGADLLEGAMAMAAVMERTGMLFEEAISRVASMEPFDRIDNLADRAAKQKQRRGT